MSGYLTPEVVPFGELHVTMSNSYGYGILGRPDPSMRSDDGVAGDINRQYAGLTVDEIENRISSFRKLPHATMTDGDLRFGIYSIFKGAETNSITFLRSTIGIDEGTSFFRSRWLSDSEAKPDAWESKLRTTEDVWEPKPHFVEKAGRLNTAGEAVLYTSLGTPATAFAEGRFELGDVFAMNRFAAKNDFKSTVVGLDPLMPGLSAANGKKLQVIQDFLDETFSYEASPDELEPYRLSRFLALEFWDMPPDMVKGWAFRSVMDRTGQGWNFSFQPRYGRQALRYKETHVYRFAGFDESRNRPRFELLAAFEAARHDRLYRLPDHRFHGVKPFWS